MFAYHKNPECYRYCLIDQMILIITAVIILVHFVLNFQDTAFFTFHFLQL